MDFEKKIIINALNVSKVEDYTVAYRNNELFNKSLEKSIIARKNGNRYFSKKNHDDKVHEKIWELYTSSIAFAPTESEELAAGFANRSAFLLHLKKHKDALLDIERALKITQSNVLKVKLFCRQAECFVALQEGKQSSSLEKAKHWLNKVEDDCERLKLNKTVEKVQQVIEDNVPNYPKREKKNDLNCENDAVAVIYDEKFGRGLIATQNFEPGEPVYIEKVYVASVNKSKMHAYCSHCLGISWALIPCDHCAYYMYCSEKCKTKAWQKYHDIECSMKQMNLYETFASYYIELSIRSLIMGIKEAGSIKKLKKMVNEVDNCEDIKTKGFSKDGRFSSNSFKSLCSLQRTKMVKKLDIMAIIAITAMQSLSKCTEIFGSDFHNKAESLEQHKDVVFIGCLLLRLMSTFVLNAFSVQSMSEGCKNTGSFKKCLESFCCSRGMSVSLMTSLINHNCDNNIFSCYYFNYATFDKDFRRTMLLSLFEFHCDCLACQQDWPTPKIIAQQENHVIKRSAKYSEMTLKIMNKHRPLIVSLNDRNRHCSKKEIQALAKDLAKLDAEKTQKPNLATASFHIALSAMMELRYFDVLKISNKCSNEN